MMMTPIYLYHGWTCVMNDVTHLNTFKKLMNKQCMKLMK